MTVGDQNQAQNQIRSQNKHMNIKGYMFLTVCANVF